MLGGRSRAATAFAYFKTSNRLEQRQQLTPSAPRLTVLRTPCCGVPPVHPPSLATALESFACAQARHRSRDPRPVGRVVGRELRRVYGIQATRGTLQRADSLPRESVTRFMVENSATLQEAWHAGR